jgi:hypothetical protein
MRNFKALRVRLFFEQIYYGAENKGKSGTAQMFSSHLSTGVVEMFSLDASAATVQREGRIR